MKKTILISAGFAVFSASLVALAGPDWQVIEKARAARRVEAPQQSADHSAAMVQMCQSMMPACQAMMKQSCQDMMQQQPK